jgi:hypothetical protein
MICGIRVLVFPKHKVKDTVAGDASGVHILFDSSYSTTEEHDFYLCSQLSIHTLHLPRGEQKKTKEIVSTIGM